METLIYPATGVKVKVEAGIVDAMLKSGFVKETAKSATATKQTPKKASKK